MPARRASIHEACEASLKRLQTSYIDLYQVAPLSQSRKGVRPANLESTNRYSPEAPQCDIVLLPATGTHSAASP